VVCGSPIGQPKFLCEHVNARGSAIGPKALLRQTVGFFVNHVSRRALCRQSALTLREWDIFVEHVDLIAPATYCRALMSVTASQIGRESAPRDRHRRVPQSPSVGSSSWVAFYVLPPAFMALPLAWYGAGMAAELSKPAGILLWGVICGISWWLSDVFARALAYLTPEQIARPWMLLTLGYLLNTAAASVYNPLVIDLMLKSGLAKNSPMVEAFFTVDRNLFDLEYLSLLYASAVPGLFCWLVGNYVFEKMSGIPRFSYPARIEASANISAPPAPAPEITAHSPSPAFFQRLTRLKGLEVDELVAIEAQDHYILVISTRGKELVYFRFRDALSELAALEGLQIHRSAWVHLKNVKGLQSQGRGLYVKLNTGDLLKVSLSNRGALLQAGIKALN
jgi:hypothetical protein